MTEKVNNDCVMYIDINTLKPAIETTSIKQQPAIFNHIFY